MEIINFMKKCLLKGISYFFIMLMLVGPLRVDFFSFFNTVSAENEPPPMLTDLYITEDVTWNSNTDLQMYENIYLDDDATLTIEQGSTIALRHLAVLWGRIEALGTMDNMITITRIPPYVWDDGINDPYCTVEPVSTIAFEGYADLDEDRESTFSFVRFTNMGGYYPFDDQDCAKMAFIDKVKDLFIPTAYAAPVAHFAPAILYHSGKVMMENCIFEKNYYADIEVNSGYHDDWNTQGYFHVIHSNFDRNEQNTAVISNFSHVILDHDYYSDCFRTCQWQHPDDYFIFYPICMSTCSISDQHDNVRQNDRIVLKDNWYGHEDGPSGIVTDDTREGEMVYGDLLLDGWRPTSDMASNVLFIPGIKASRLYKERSVVGNDKLWPPNNYADIDDLMLDDDGESVEDVFTQDVIDEVAIPVLGGNIYKSFIGDLTDLKEKNIMKDFSLYAYDWRYDMENITQNGTLYPDNEIKNAVNEVERLAESSVSTQVTIVAHSMGGLLAKTVMQELERRGEASLIDTIVLVDTPQMGTPQAIPALLHGTDEGLPIPGLMDDMRARKFGENMSSAYGLLPSQNYFDRADGSLIEFATDLEPYESYKEAYGDTIDQYDEFRSFLLGEDDKRDKPAYNDLVSANVLNGKLFDQAHDIHESIDAWTPPQDITLIQIGGWGLDTLRGVKYTEKEEMICEDDPAQDFLFYDAEKCTLEHVPHLEPQYTIDGDDVVTTPSALMVSMTENVERYWVDLYSYNDENRDKKHKNILEAVELREFISQYILQHETPEQLQDYISTKRPDDSKISHTASRIRMSLYSPLDIHLYDTQGNHTGPVTVSIDGEDITTIEENIPNSYYDVYGENKYVGWGTGSDVRVELDGYDRGSYSVHLQEFSATSDGEQGGDVVTFVHLPTSADTKAIFTVPTGGLVQMSDLVADYDGDGVSDYTISPQNGSSVSLSHDDSSDDSDDATSTKKTHEDVQKASIDHWSAYLYTTQTESCPTKLKLKLTGTHFDKDAIIKIGNTKAKRSERDSHRKMIATFCMDDLLRVKTDPIRSVSMKNPDAKRDKAHKKIDIFDIAWDITDADIQKVNMHTPEGIIAIQRILNNMGYLENKNISGTIDVVTTDAIKTFQKDHGISQTGYCGELTIAKFGEIINN